MRHEGTSFVGVARSSLSSTSDAYRDRFKRMLVVPHARGARPIQQSTGVGSRLRRCKSRKDLDRSFTGDDAEVAVIEGEHGAAISFRASDDRGVGISERQIVIAIDEIQGSGEVADFPLHIEFAVDQGMQELRHPMIPKTWAIIKVTSDDAGRHDQRRRFSHDVRHSMKIRVSRIHRREQCGGVDGHQSGFQFSSR